MKMCTICGKKPVSGNSITKRGMAKKQGGVGRKTVRSNKRRFLPNLQRVTALLNGSVKRIRVCTSCLRSGLVVKAPYRAASQPA